MKPRKTESERDEATGFQIGRVMSVLVIAIIVIVLGVFVGKRGTAGKTEQQSGTIAEPETRLTETMNRAEQRFARHSPQHNEPKQTAQEIVFAKMTRFARSRRELVHGLTKKANVVVPAAVDKFFDTLEGGDWSAIKAEYAVLQAAKTNENSPVRELNRFWRPITEAYGAAEQVHAWPAQALLDYGNSILGALKPGMIYAGGTDAGCFIPTMLNDTSDGEQHVVITQNALADSSYLEYLQFKYGEQMNTLSSDDSQKVFQEYIADAQKRLTHDQNLPNELKQIRAGEDVRVTDNRVQVSGQVAVMMINEKLFQMLMAKNPGASFGMEESFPFESMQGNASTLGPILEPGAQRQGDGLTQERARQSVEEWRAATQQLVSNPDATDDSAVRAAYAKLISSQAGLLAKQDFQTEAEEDFQIANQLQPGNVEVVFKYVGLLMHQNRTADATAIVERAIQAAPENKQFQSLLGQLKTQR